MTYYYWHRAYPQAAQPGISKQTIDLWKRYADKTNWRITELYNGYYQTEFMLDDDDWKAVTRRETIEGAERAIDSSIDHYKRKLRAADGPVVVKTFTNESKQEA
jgi:hypothetical protein